MVVVGDRRPFHPSVPSSLDEEDDATGGGG